MAKNKTLPDSDGTIRLPDSPGLDIQIDTEDFKKCVAEVEIHVQNKKIYSTPDFND